MEANGFFIIHIILQEASPIFVDRDVSDVFEGRRSQDNSFVYTMPHLASWCSSHQVLQCYSRPLFVRLFREFFHLVRAKFSLSLAFYLSLSLKLSSRQEYNFQFHITRKKFTNFIQCHKLFVRGYVYILDNGLLQWERFIPLRKVTQFHSQQHHFQVVKEQCSILVQNNKSACQNEKSCTKERSNSRKEEMENTIVKPSLAT